MNSEITLRWEVDENINLIKKIPQNNRLYSARATKFLLLVFWNYQDMKEFRATAFDKRTKQPLMINGKAEYKGQVYLRRPNPLPRLVVTAACKFDKYYSYFDYALNRHSNSTLLHLNNFNNVWHYKVNWILIKIDATITLLKTLFEIIL